MGNINIKKKELKRLKEKVENYRADVEAAKASAHFMLRKYKAHVVPNKKKFNKKKERRKNKIKGF